jgi:hypothetical protein
MLKDILLPCIALVGLTAAIWLIALHARIAEMRLRKLSSQSVATMRDISQLLQNTRASDNFSNLFELPVLFYMLCIALVVTHAESTAYVTTAWIFMALRIAHSLIQVTYNRVSHRLICWLLSTLCLFGMWGKFAVDRIFA